MCAQKREKESSSFLNTGAEAIQTTIRKLLIGTFQTLDIGFFPVNSNARAVKESLQSLQWTCTKVHEQSSWKFSNLR